MSNDDETLDFTEDEKRRLDSWQGSAEDQRQVPLNNPKGDSTICNECNGKIGMMDVEGHYSGMCAACRRKY
jgi:hypothetical protein